MKATASLIQDSLIVWDIEESRSLYRIGFYGKPLGIPKPKDASFNSPLILDLIEATYLVEKNMLRITREGREMPLEEIKEYGERTYERFMDKYLVYRDLRERGFIVTPGIKFGSDFAAYKHGPGIDHAPFIIQVKEVKDCLSAFDIVRSGRLATSVRKHFTIAIPDRKSGRVTYLVFEWFKA
ncbi:MAG TPA: tRNA-intron lyase [Candidatus Caldiarchaeum subterraneum]|uniref:tRNA-intron lyase n=1 Tax=Caldiarchaeum subterraneum TaxID=311458 RepID=A0A833ECA5_CALS0|nr:tRNA-intron lyase [Aigarchaeota archaeon]HIQ29615.1 tRNA-intron lyase [Candidatus Caldarchaeum subterraneum]